MANLVVTTETSEYPRRASKRTGGLSEAMQSVVAICSALMNSSRPVHGS